MVRIPNVYNLNMTKECPSCKTIKPKNCFAKNVGRKDGLQSSCRECRKVYFKTHYEENKKYYIDKAYDRKLRIQKEFIEWLADKSCMDCGNSDIRVLEFDHRGEKEYNVSHLVNTGRDKAAYEEIKKCDIVCANCHRIRTAQQFNWAKHSFQAPLT